MITEASHPRGPESFAPSCGEGGSITGRFPRQSSTWQLRWERWALPLLMLLATALLLVNLGSRPLCGDEIINVIIDRQDLNSVLANLSVTAPGPTTRLVGLDLHPPLFHLIQHVWLNLAGSSDLAVRLPSVVYALIALLLLYRIGRLIDGRGTACWALLLVAISPFWLLYARMARYYALTAMLGLASTLLYLELLKRPTRPRWTAYVLVNTAMLYTDYLVATLLICQLLYLIWARPARSWLVTWTATMALVGAVYLPWLHVWLKQSAILVNQAVVADLSRSLVGTLLMLVFPWLSFTVGETVFPWEFPAIVAGLLFVGLLLRGLSYFLRHPATADWPGSRPAFATLFIVIPLLATTGVLTVLAPVIPFIAAGNHAFFVFPFVGLLAAAGLRAIDHRGWRVAAIGLLALAHSYSIRNYYAGEHFINPVYAVPTDTVVADVMSLAQPGDAIVSDFDTGFGYYFEQVPRGGVTHYYIDSPEGQGFIDDLARDIAERRQPRHQRLFILIFGRDRTRRDLPAAFTKIIEPAAQMRWERGYTPQDETYRRLKRRLLGREDYRFKLLVRLYELPG